MFNWIKQLWASFSAWQKKYINDALDASNERIRQAQEEKRKEQ